MKATPRNSRLFAVILAVASVTILLVANLRGQIVPYLTVAPTGTNQLLITVINSNSATYYLQTTPVLANTNYPWTIITNGTQTNFTVNVGPYADSFYRVLLSTNNPGQGFIAVFIDNPTNGATVQ